MDVARVHCADLAQLHVLDRTADKKRATREMGLETPAVEHDANTRLTLGEYLPVMERLRRIRKTHCPHKAVAQGRLVEFKSAPVVDVDPLVVAEDRNLLTDQHVDEDRKGYVSAEDDVIFHAIELNHAAFELNTEDRRYADQSFISQPTPTC